MKTNKAILEALVQQLNDELAKNNRPGMMLAGSYGMVQLTSLDQSHNFTNLMKRSEMDRYLRAAIAGVRLFK